MEEAQTRIRQFQEEDAAGCALVLHAAVHELAGRYYSPAQRAAWAAAVLSPEALRQRLRGQHVLVAEDNRGIAGFMSLRLPDQLDFAYVRPDRAGKGVADLLYDSLIDAARRSGTQSLWVHASELACRFLKKRGWRVLHRRDFEHNGVAIYNYRMSIVLERPEQKPSSSLENET